MPFGLCDAHSSFQRLMGTIMRGLPFVKMYMDNVLIHSSNEEIHKSHLEDVLQQLQDAGLTLHGSKFQVGLPEVRFLTCLLWSDRDARQCLGQNCGGVAYTPNNAKEVQQFVGLASYCRQFVSWFADIAALLHHLT